MTDPLPDDDLPLPPGAAVDLDAKVAAALERVGQALRVQMWGAAKENGLTPTQLQVLLRLATDPPTRRRIGVLAAALDVTHPTVSDAVAVLARKGLVQRDAGGRRAALSLTEGGFAIADGISGWDDQTRLALRELDDADKRAALRVLVELIARLQREGTITVARMCATCRFFRRDAHPGSARPHHCGLVDAPMADDELRVDCAEHEPAAVAGGI